MTKKGNKNALKHGIYSKFIAVADSEILEKMKNDANKDEIALARTRLADAISHRDKAADEDTKLKWDYACRHWTEIIDSMLFHNKKQGETEVMIFTSLLEAVRAANDKQSVKQ